jgi:peptidoglycan/xylan/chitin deacetylase (PgdA/CDA1 family)
VRAGTAKEALTPLIPISFLVAAGLLLLPPPCFAKAAGQDGERPSRQLALTIDDLPVGGPDEGIRSVEEINRRIVGALRRAKVPAVGFVNEEKLYRPGEVDRRIAILDEWLSAGLDLGNHTFSHPDFNKVGLAAYEEDIVRGETVTRRLLQQRGMDLRWFRQTFLRTGRTLEERDALLAYLGHRGYTAVPVTIENDDWFFNARYCVALAKGDRNLASRIAQAYLEHWGTMFSWYESMSDRLFGRPIPQIILIHGNRLNADHLPEVLAWMTARGYAFTTVEAALADPAYLHEDRYAGPWGKSWLQRWLYTDGEDTLGKEPDPPRWVIDLPDK